MKAALKSVQICLLLLPCLANAQFTFTTNNDGTLNVASFSGSGIVVIPGITNGLRVISIGNSAFASNSGLMSVTIPNTVTNISDYAFYYCIGLTNISITNSVINLGYRSFCYCSNLSGIMIPDSVTSIGQFCFQQCEAFTNVTIPDGVTNIGNGAFSECFNLTTITLPNGLTSIGDEMFFDSINLASVKIPNSVTSIGQEAFWSCGLTNITFGSGLGYIGTNAFNQCVDLQTVTIPASVTNIDSYAFTTCLNLGAIFFEGDAPSADSTVFSEATGDFPGPDGLPAAVYYLPNTMGWYSPFGGLPAVLWNPSIQTTNFTFGVQNNQFGFTIAGTTNIPVVIEACSNLTSSMWTRLKSCFLTNGSIYFGDSQWTNYPTRLYRVRSP